MKLKKIATVFLAGLLMLALTACQSTPEEEIVVGKDLEKMIEMANAPTDTADSAANQAEVDTEEEVENALALKIGAPETYTDEFTDARGGLTVKVDADVIVPNVSVIDMLRVEKSKFTNEKAAKLIDALVHSQLYECTEDGIFNTKEAFTDLILSLKEYTTHLDDTDNIENMKSYIESLQYYYEAAPEEKTAISGEFEHKAYPDANGEWSVSEEVETIQGLAYSKEYGYETFSGRNTVTGEFNRVFYIREPNSGVNVNGTGQYYTADEISETKAEKCNFMGIKLEGVPDISITQEEATRQADDLLEKIGEGWFACYSAEKVYGGSCDMVSGRCGTTNPLRCVWRLHYARTVGGISATYTGEQGSSSEDELQAAPWAYEDIMFYIDDSGIVGFAWISPYEVTGTAVEDANVTSFDGIMEVFETMMPVNYSWSEGDCTVEIAVTEIRFGLSRVTEENERDTGLLIPVWDFFGTYTVNTVSEDGEIISDTSAIPPDRSLLTINAIDGSVIDRGLGY